jgi:hypothetical protein
MVKYGYLLGFLYRDYVGRVFRWPKRWDFSSSVNGVDPLPFVKRSTWT